MARSTSNSNSRGSSAQRRARKLWLLAEFGDGKRAPCMLEEHKDGCPGYVTFKTISVDRHPVAGVDGGTYARGNIRPAYGPCNYSHGGKLGAKRAKEKV